MARYRKTVVTEAQKDAAHNLFTNAESGDAPKSDLEGLWTDAQQAEFRREARLDDFDSAITQRTAQHENAALVAARPSRSAPPASAPQPPVAAPDYDQEAARFGGDFGMRGRLHSRATILQFIRAGNATITVVSKVTGKRFTFQFQQPKNWTPSPERPVAPTFCKVLSGAENTGDYTFVGTMWPEDSAWPDAAQVYRHSAKSRMSAHAPSVKALVWFVRTALYPGRGGTSTVDSSPDLDKCEVWHEGRCGRCGRKLTVPSSIESGYGPECAGRM